MCCYLWFRKILQADNQDSLPPLIQLEPQGRKHFRHVSTILNPTICRDNWNVGPSPLERIGNRRCDRTNLVFWTIVISDNNSDWRKSASRQLWWAVVDTTSDTITLRERDMDWDEGGHKFWWEWTQILRDKENGSLDNQDGSASTAAPARTLSPRSKVICTNGLQKLVPRKKKFSFF